MLASAVRNGVRRIVGHVETFAEKLEAEHPALAIRGVKGVAQEIIVRLPSEKTTDDNELADHAARLLSWDARLHGDRRLSSGRARLGYPYRAGAVSGRARVASSDVKRLYGVVSITDSISLRPAAGPSDVEGRLEDALGRRHAGPSRRPVSPRPARSSSAGSSLVGPTAAARRGGMVSPGVGDVIDNLQISTALNGVRAEHAS